jgi:hypothetical protein
MRVVSAALSEVVASGVLVTGEEGRAVGGRVTAAAVAEGCVLDMVV